MELGLGKNIYEGVRKRMEKEKRSHRETGGRGRLLNLVETGRLTASGATSRQEGER